MKRLIGILTAIIMILSGGAYLAYKKSDLILEKIISRKMEVPVTIQRVQFNKGFFQIEKFQMENPKEAELPLALKIETIRVDSPYRQYFEDPIVIDQIHLDTVYVNIEIYDKDQTEGNWHTIMSHMEKEHSSSFSVERSTLIKKLILTNIQIDLILSDGKVRHLSPIKRLEFYDIDSEKGIPIEEISEIIVQKMMSSIFLEKGLKSIIEAPVKILKGFFPFF